MMVKCTKCRVVFCTMESHEPGIVWVEPHQCKVDSASTNTQSTPCHVPHCKNEGTVHLCDVHWADVPQ
jgi:hypothetical protein